MKPYYQHGGITIYHGDCREVILCLGTSTETVITDPVWPNSKAKLVGCDRPWELLAEAIPLLDCTRLVVQLGCDSDPRTLMGVPPSLPFLRVCWLEFACPTRKGRILYSGDVAYVFGAPPKSVPGRRVMPGRFTASRIERRQREPLRKHREFGKPSNGDHPCPRRLQHLQWLVGKFAEGTVLDPFCGSGTTLLAAKTGGYQAIGIEIEERYCEIAASRLAQEVFAL